MDRKSVIVATLTIVYVIGFVYCGEYPAGVDPKSCPDYPNCDNAALHAAKGDENSWNFPSRWNSADSWNPSYGSLAVDSGNWKPEIASPIEAARYPAGVDPRRCPSYPNCDNAALHRTSGAFAVNDDASGFLWGTQKQKRISFVTPDWNAAPNSHATSGSSIQYPAGINAKNCPDYPYC